MNVHTDFPTSPSNIDVAKRTVSGMTIKDLDTTYDIVWTLDSVLSGLSAQPRSDNNDVLHVVEAITDVLEDLRVKVIDTAKSFQPECRSDHDLRSALILRDMIHFADPTSTIAHMAAGFAAQKFPDRGAA